MMQTTLCLITGFIQAFQSQLQRKCIDAWNAAHAALYLTGSGAAQVCVEAFGPSHRLRNAHLASIHCAPQCHTSCKAHAPLTRGSATHKQQIYIGKNSVDKSQVLTARTLISTLQVAEQKGARSSKRGKSTCLLTFLRFIPAWKDANNSVRSLAKNEAFYTLDGKNMAIDFFKCTPELFFLFQVDDKISFTFTF